MIRNIEGRLAKAERVAGVSEDARLTLQQAERAVLFRTRLEGGSVWATCGGHVLYPLNHPWFRHVFFAMFSAQDETTKKQVLKSLEYCLEHDPFMLDANYPLLEYYLWTVRYFCGNNLFPLAAVPVELCEWLQAIKPAEYMHYRPKDWCWQCGYRYPAVAAGLCNDIRAFLISRYSEEQLTAMTAPFRGKACMLCGGEIVDYRGMAETKYNPSVENRWAGSPASRLCESRHEEWIGEIAAVQVPESFNYPYLEDADNITAWMDRAEEDFNQRRGKQHGFVREEHRPSVEAIKPYYAMK